MGEGIEHRRGIGNREFVVLMATLMSMVALTIDAMLPALGQMVTSLRVDDPNDVQLVISTIFLGMAAGLMVYGPLSDSFGRKRSIYLGAFIYLAGSLIALFSASLPVMLTGRVLQGFGAASYRVVSMAMIRDKFEGREMARIMSLIIIMFILVPALAPSIGQLLLFVSDWRAIFVLFIVMGIGGPIWLHVRQPETLHPGKRRPFSLRSIGAGLLETLKHPVSRGYTLASGLIFGCIVAYLSSSQQILQVQYGLGDLFPVYFGVLALAIGIASYTNSKLVFRFPVVVLCLSALTVLCANSLLFIGYAYYMGGHPNLYALMGYLLVTFFCFGILFGNFNALALQPMGHIAGVANSVISSIQTLMSVALGGVVGQLYDGTVLPLVLGILIFGTGSLAVTVHTTLRARR